jgi:hypothetical protein
MGTRITRRFRPHHFAPGRREAIAPAALVIVRGAFVGTELDYQAVHEHGLDAAAQGAWAQPEFSVRAGRDVMHDGVAVLVARRRRKKNMEDPRGR